MVGIDDVARRAGVSTATVSRALSGRGPVAPATHARVADAAAALGYVVSSSASGLASGRTRNVGVLVPLLDRWYFSAVVTGIADTLMRAGYDVTLYSLTADRGERERLFATFLRRQRVDAVVAIALDLSPDEIARLAALDMPVVAIGGPNPGLATLELDDVAVARAATAHLTALGHRDIALLGAGAAAAGDFPVVDRRRRGFGLALADAGIPASPDRAVAADFTVADGHRAALRLFEGPGPLPTAIFAIADEMAIGAILAARELGLRVPEDISVVGVDGHELAAFFGLTTVEQLPRAQGERAARTVLGALAATDAAPPASAALEWELVVRTSTGAPTS